MASALPGISTRKETEVWLIGQPISRIESRKLPSKGDVLRRLFFLMRNDKKNVKDAAEIVEQEVVGFWQIAKIPTIADYHAAPKVEKEYNKWRSLQKGSSRRSAPQIEKEKIFVNKLNDLFDIAHANALGPLTLAEDQGFLLAQREKGRRGYMAGVDREFAKQQARKQSKKEAQERLQQKDQHDCKKLTDMVELASTGSSSSEDDVTTTVLRSSPKTKRVRRSIISQDVASALDHTQTSD